MNWYKVMYWVTRADSVRDFFRVFSDIFTVLFVIFGVLYLISLIIGPSGPFNDSNSSEWDKDEIATLRHWRKMLRWVWMSFMIVMLITWTGYVLTPSKKDALLIIAGGGTLKFLTTDSSARQLPHEMTTFVVSELKAMSAEAKVNLGLEKQKSKILDEAKNMSAKELLEKMKLDSNFAKIVLDK